MTAFVPLGWGSRAEGRPTTSAVSTETRTGCLAGFEPYPSASSGLLPFSEFRSPPPPTLHLVRPLLRFPLHLLADFSLAPRSALLGVGGRCGQCFQCLRG